MDVFFPLCVHVAACIAVAVAAANVALIASAAFTNAVAVVTSLLLCTGCCCFGMLRREWNEEARISRDKNV